MTEVKDIVVIFLIVRLRWQTLSSTFFYVPGYGLYVRSCLDTSNLKHYKSFLLLCCSEQTFYSTTLLKHKWLNGVFTEVMPNLYFNPDHYISFFFSEKPTVLFHSLQWCAQFLKKKRVTCSMFSPLKSSDVKTHCKTVEN